jgi:hypothetical protein
MGFRYWDLALLWLDLYWVIILIADVRLLKTREVVVKSQFRIIIYVQFSCISLRTT